MVNGVRWPASLAEDYLVGSVAKAASLYVLLILKPSNSGSTVVGHKVLKRIPENFPNLIFHGSTKIVPNSRKERFFSIKQSINPF